METLKKKFIIILLIFSFINLNGQDFLKSSTATGNGTTINNSKNWTDVVTTNIDVTGVTKVLVTASLNMRPDGSNDNGREANYRIKSNDLTIGDSGVIKRQLIKNSEVGVESWGIGTLVHIFDVSSVASPTSISFTLEHSNKGVSQTGRNVYTSVRLTAVALTTTSNNYELSNDVKRISTDVTTTSATFESLLGSTTNNINLPNEGDIYVVASINSRSNGTNNLAEYKLEYSSNGGANWFDLGKPVKRSMINNFDDGIISLVGLKQGLTAGSDYQFRISHRRVSGTNTIFTNNVNLVAIALSHNGGGYFPSFYSEVGSIGVDITGVGTAASDVTSTTFTTTSDIGSEKPDTYVSSQFLLSASNLSVSPDERMRGSNQLFLNNGGGDLTENKYYRYIPDNDNFGSGGTIGLAENLDSNSLYTIGMKHSIDFVSNSTSDETLTTSEVILAGFQLFDKPNSTLGIIDEETFEKKYLLYKSYENIEFKSDDPIDATIRIYNSIGQLMELKSISNKREITISNLNYKGIVFVSIELSEGIFIKKMLL